uniref:hypothetical protein n=2 Tax=Candidatus Planktophila sp. TaxID=2175601 RepID=UPI00404ADDB0
MATLDSKIKTSRIRTTALILLALVASSTVPASAAVLPAITSGNWSTISTTWGVGALAITPPTSTSTGEWTYVSRNTGVASVVGSVLSINGVGATTLVATQAATADFLSISRNISVVVAGKAPTVGVFSIPSQSLNNPVYTLTPPTSTSAGAWSFKSSNENIAKISGNTATLIGSGSAVITATQAADWNWATISKNATLTVSGATPTLGNFSNVTLTLGVFTAITLVPPTSNSNGPWSYISSNTGVATILGNQISPVGAGSTTITATQSPIGNFSAGVASMTLTVLGGPPTLGKYANVDVALRPLSANTYTLTPPTSNSSGVWTFVSSDSSIVSIAGNTATLYQVGAVTITASQSASGNFGASGTATMRFTVLPATPTLATWGNIEKSFGEATFNLTPPSSSSAGTWSYVSSNPTVATITGNNVTILGAGQTTIIATQAANWNWSEATTQLTLNVLPITPTISGFTALTAVVGDPAITITAPTSNSTAPWTYTSSNSNIATISGGTLAVVDSGTATITAKQAAGGNYLISEEISTTIKVYKRPVIGALENKSVKFGIATLLLTLPTSDSDGSWTVESTDPLVVTVNGLNLEIKKVGKATITLKQSQTETYLAAEKSFEVVVDPATPVVGTLAAINKVFTATTSKLIAPTSNSNGVWSYQISDESIGSIVDGNLVLKKAGTATITATQAATSDYLGTQISTTLQVNPYVLASASKRVITIAAKGVTAKVYINGKKAKIGKNTVTAGKKTVTVLVGGKEIYRKKLTIK